MKIFSYIHVPWRSLMKLESSIPHRVFIKYHHRQTYISYYDITCIVLKEFLG